MNESEHPVNETAARHLARRLPLARAEESVGAVLERLPGALYDSVDAVYILGAEGRLEGLARLTDLLAGRRDRPIRDVMILALPAAHLEDDQERVASLAVEHAIAAVPVVDPDGRFVGVVPPRALIGILRAEHVEDLHRLAGIAAEDVRARTALEAGVARRARDRFPWLLVGLAGSVLAAYVVGRFEHTLRARLAVAFFIPGIVYLADAIGTQTEAIVVRGLSHGHGPLGRLFRREFQVGLLMGLLLGAFAIPAAWLLLGDLPLALAVGLSVFVAGGIATAVGLLLPWALSALGSDPAFGSGPLATIVQDVLSVLIYLGVVALFVL